MLRHFLRGGNERVQMLISIDENDDDWQLAQALADALPRRVVFLEIRRHSGWQSLRRHALCTGG